MAVAQVSAKNNPYGLPKELFKIWNSLTLEEKVGQMVMVYMAQPGFMIENKFGPQNIEYVDVNPTAGSHCGPNGVGVCFHAIHR